MDLIYVRAFGDFRKFDARLQGVAARFADRVRLTKVTAGELGRFTCERVFVARGAPTVVLVRAGEVVASATGELPAAELERLVRRATESAS